MAPKSLIVMVAVLGAIGASGKACQTTQDRLSSAVATEALAKVRPPPIKLPQACTAKMGRVYPKLGEAHVITQKRWEFSADNRDRQAENCQAWEDQYNNSAAMAGNPEERR